MNNSFRFVLEILAGAEQDGVRQDVHSLCSGKVCVEKNVDADQQEGINAAEPGPEHALPDGGNPRSCCLLRPVCSRQTHTCHLTTRHLTHRPRICTMKHTSHRMLQSKHRHRDIMYRTMAADAPAAAGRHVYLESYGG